MIFLWIVSKQVEYSFQNIRSLLSLCWGDSFRRKVDDGWGLSIGHGFVPGLRMYTSFSDLATYFYETDIRITLEGKDK